MGTDTRETKKELVDNGLRGITAKHRRQLAHDLLLPGSALPAAWLSAPESTFLALHPDTVLDDAARAAGAELLRHLAAFCGRLVPDLIDAHAVRHDLDTTQRRHLHQNVSVVVRNMLLDRCPAWPGPDVAALDPALFVAVDAALTGERAQQQPADPGQRLVLRQDKPPEGHLDAEERRHKWVTSDPEVLARHVAQSREQSRRAWADTMRGLVNGAGAAAVFVAVFLLLRGSGLGLTFRQDLIAAAASTGASAVGLLRAFVPRAGFRRSLSGRPPDAEPGRPDLH